MKCGLIIAVADFLRQPFDSIYRERTMLEIIIIMCAGMAAGVLLRGREKIQAMTDRLTLFSIYLLLFLLGLSVGLNEKIITAFPDLGFKAIVITLSSVAGSVILSWILYITLFRKRGKA